MSADLGHLRAWIGRTARAVDRASAWQADMLSATLDRDDPPLRDGDPLPPGWHWIYFPEVVRLSDLGADGHARLGGFLPPVPLPRRMWAGNRQRYLAPLHVGERLARESEVLDVRPKSGRGGDLCFVTVRHTVHGEAGPATEEEHDIVYRAPPLPGAVPVPVEPPGGATWRRRVQPSPPLLFRFSALTMNAHRIHYDRDFCRAEGYAGLLVHGPLVMLLLLDLLRRELPAARPAAVAARAVAPVLDTAPLALHGRPDPGGAGAALWAVNGEGALALHAEVELAG